MALASCEFDRVTNEVLELVLARLPVPSLLTAGRVCKNWCSVVRASGFPELYDKETFRKAWFFQNCVNYFCPAKNQCYGFDPETQQWHLISSRCYSVDQGTMLAGSPDGSLFSIFGLRDLAYKREFLSDVWERAPAMHNSRNSPLLGVVDNGSAKSHQLIVAGGVSFFEEDDRAVELYDSSSGSWEVCQSLPSEFSGNCSRHWMTSAVSCGKFYIAEIYTGAVASFDLKKRVWSDVRTVRPPGIFQSHLLSCQDRLLLAGSCYAKESYTFKLWKVNEATMECGPEFACMPSDLCNLFGSTDDEDDLCNQLGPTDDDDDPQRKGEGIQCVASGDVIYIFFPASCRERSQANRVVFCDLSNGGNTWALLPPLPVTSLFNYAVGFSSPVKLGSLGSTGLVAGRG